MDIDYDEVYNKVLYDPPRPCSCGGNCQCGAGEDPVYRDWGYWQVLEEGDGYKIKKLIIKPGKEISRQFHNERSESWTITNGMCKVERGYPDLLEVDYFRKGQSFHILQKEVHKVINKGTTDLVAIEVQVGTRCEESDIQRI